MSFASRFGKGLLASLESEEEVVEPTVDAVEAETADNVEAAVAEVADTAAEVSDTDEAIDEAIEDSNTLEEVADVMEETEQEGGADPVTARVAEVAVEAIYARLGMKRKPMASLEAFGDKATRIEATRLSVESMRETVKKIWDAIVALFGRIKEAIVKFFKAIFVATERTSQRAKKLAAMLESINGAPKEETVTGGFVRTLATGTEFDKAATLKSVYELSKYAVELGKACGDVAKAESSLDVVKMVNDASVFENYTNDVIANGKALDEKATKLFGLVADEGSYWADVTGGIQIGNGILAVRLPKDSIKGEAALKAFGKMQARVLSTGGEGPAKDAKAPALTKEEVTKLLKDVVDGMKTLEDSKSLVESMVKAMDGVRAKAKSAGAEAKEVEGAEARAKVLSGAVRGLGSVVSGLSTQGTKQAVVVASAALDYAQKSMKNIGEAAAAEEKKEPAEKE